MGTRILFMLCWYVLPGNVHVTGLDIPHMSKGTHDVNVTITPISWTLPRAYVGRNECHMHLTGIKKITKEGHLIFCNLCQPKYDCATL